MRNRPTSRLILYETRLFLHISPEVGYTRWKADQQPDPYVHANQNQVEVLLGITF